MRKILLVEPGYKNKYPPLGLMKISTYHKLRGDFVKFTKGIDRSDFLTKWDRIYISTLFTFHWDITIKTIKAYFPTVRSTEDIFVGGVMATLMHDEIKKETEVTIIKGLIDQPKILDPDGSIIVDRLVPDYKIFEQSNYKYAVNDAYIAYATRGCPNSCSFCAVNKIEPVFQDYIPMKKQIVTLEELYGPRQNLLLLDNNVLASKSFEKIIKDIIELGFYKGAELFGRKRYVDFNQGIDIRLLDESKMQLLSMIAIKPLRLAFDHIALEKLYVEKVQLARKYGIIHLSNYVLYNYEDSPEDFYQRLKINVQLNKELDTRIYSFPMKYVPLDAKDRSYIGEKWNKRLLRGIQCILLATKGKVGIHENFFEAAFGSSFDEFLEIAMMPDPFIIYRNKFKENGAKKWVRIFRKLDNDEMKIFKSYFGYGKKALLELRKDASPRLKKLIDIELDVRYQNKNSDSINPNYALRR